MNASTWWLGQCVLGGSHGGVTTPSLYKEYGFWDIEYHLAGGKESEFVQEIKQF